MTLETGLVPPSERGGLTFKPLTGEALLDYLPDLARLRMEVFRSFPYLYEGDPAYEENYLQTYAQTRDAVVVCAFDGDRVVGASTALPLEQEEENFQKPFRDLGIDPRDVFYFGESVLEAAYRGRGAGVAFFEHREAHARSFNRFRAAAFCGVIRPDDHPLKPEGYKPLDSFWTNRGFKRLEGAVAQYSWQDIDQDEETGKPLQFWIKSLL
ncbi:GNAT family N-acetyltransferase [Kiloniella sp. b19]|uniref:GNAT family N-acetyltransferase n=1 Tax=Kiloniella sp. GXU_MW_B19 TaxID=3141326 RepID=UPI0031CE28A8